MEQDGAAGGGGGANDEVLTLTWDEYRRITNLCVHKLR